MAKQLAGLIVFVAALAAAYPAGAVTPVQLGGTGASNSGTDDRILIGNGSGAFVEVLLDSCTGTANCLQYDSSNNDVLCTEIEGVGGGGGTGDIEGVGNCTTGSCFQDGTVGQTLVFEGSTTGSGQVSLTVSGDPASDYTLTLPAETGTICSTAAVCSGYSSSAHQHTLGNATATSWFTGAANGNSLVFEGTTTDEFDGTLIGADFTGTRTITIPNEDGTICTTGSVCTGYGNVTGPGSAVDNAVVAFNGTGGKTLESTECVMSDEDSDGANDRITCPEGFDSADQGCANNTDCNVWSIPYNDGGGTPTCTTMGVANTFKLLPKSDATLALCAGTTEVGEVANPAVTYVTRIFPEGAINTGFGAVTFPAADNCRCQPLILPLGIQDLDKITLSVETTDASATACEISIYSWDGATQYFDADCSTAIDSANASTLTNTIGTPSAMVPGQYQLCYGIDSASAITAEWNSAHSGNIQAPYYDLSCANGATPASVTDGSVASWVWGNTDASQPVGLGLADE